MAKLKSDGVVPLRDGRELVIRSAAPRDTRALVGLLDSVAAEPEVTLLLEPGQADAGEWRRRITQEARAPRGILLVGLAAGELVASLGLSPDPHPGSAHVCIFGMSVARAWRALGVGSALLELALSWAAEHGFTKVELGVFPENERAIRFYERHGFTREGLRKAQYDRAGRYHDEVLMARFLTTVS